MAQYSYMSSEECFQTGPVQYRSVSATCFLIYKCGGHIFPVKPTPTEGIPLFPDNDFVTFNFPAVGCFTFVF